MPFFACIPTQMEPISEETDKLFESMQTSQIVCNPTQREVTTTLEKLTNIVNQQTIKGYKTGYNDGFIIGALNGISVTLIVTGLIMIIREKL